MRRSIPATALVLLASLGLQAASAYADGCAPADTTSRVVCTYASGSTQLIVPAGANAFALDIRGAQGGSPSAASAGGKGAEVRASDVPVPAAGEPLTVSVGGQGGNGGTLQTSPFSFPSAGGGAPDGGSGAVIAPSGDRVTVLSRTDGAGGGGSTTITTGWSIVAEAGGGGGGGYAPDNGAPGGNAGSAGTAGKSFGTEGGGGSGATPGGGGFLSSVTCATGTASDGVRGNPGLVHVGGAGGGSTPTDGNPGGGGGGGYAGGGGGSSSGSCTVSSSSGFDAGGGGGGSSLAPTDATNPTILQGSAAPGIGGGSATVSFVAPAPVAAVVANPQAADGTITLDACASTATGAGVQYVWDTNGDGTADVTTSACSVAFLPGVGTYAPTVKVEDAYGQTASATASYTAAAPVAVALPAGTIHAAGGTPTADVRGARITATLHPLALAIVWRAGRPSGSITISGTISAASALVLAVVPKGGAAPILTKTFAAPKGSWKQVLKLPAGARAGSYSVRVSAPTLSGVATAFTLAPPNGTISSSYASARVGGPPAKTVGRTGVLWARFRFASLPAKSQAIETLWIQPDGKRLAARTRPRLASVEAEVAELDGETIPRGVWICVLKVGGVQLATVRVTVTS